jgi:hypothetical protein
MTICRASRKAVRQVQSTGLEIRATTDLKSYNRIIPALDAFLGAFIGTDGEEVYCWPTCLEELVSSANPRERVIRCHRAHEIALTRKALSHPIDSGLTAHRFAVDQRPFFSTGAGGILYQPGALTPSPGDACCGHGSAKRLHTRQAIFDRDGFELAELVLGRLRVCADPEMLPSKDAPGLCSLACKGQDVPRAG